MPAWTPMQRLSPTPGSMASWACDSGGGKRRAVGRRGSPGSRRACPASGAGAGPAQGATRSVAAHHRRPGATGLSVLALGDGARHVIAMAMPAAQGAPRRAGWTARPDGGAPLAGAPGLRSQRRRLAALSLRRPQGALSLRRPCGSDFPEGSKGEHLPRKFLFGPKTKFVGQRGALLRSKGNLFSFFWGLPSASECAERKSGICGGSRPPERPPGTADQKATNTREARPVHMSIGALPATSSRTTILNSCRSDVRRPARRRCRKTSATSMVSMSA